MVEIGSFLALIIPWWICRVFALKGLHPLGFIQDLFVASLVLLIPFDALRIFSGVVLTLLVVFDSAMYKVMGLRFEAPFFSFIFDLPHYWDSAKENLKYIPIILAAFGFTFVGLYFLPKGHFHWVFLLGLYVPKKAFYHSSNILFLLLSYPLKKFGGKRDDDFLKKHFTPMNEQAVPVSSEYPLLKETVGFHGNKAISLDVDSTEKPHVIFLLMESFRSKDLCYAPNFQSLAKEGVYFPNFYTNSVKTSRALTSVLFGVPSDVDGRDLSNDMDFPLISIADVMQKNGYHTGYFHNGPLEFENQLQICANHGFETLIGKNEIFAEYGHAAMSSWGVPDEFLMRYTVEYLKKAKQSSFLTLFTMTNHHPWPCPPGYEAPDFGDVSKTYRRFLTTYSYSDWALGQLVTNLRQTGLSKDVILFVLGDHGQPMGEHSVNYVEQKALYEENIHVPLLILADGRITPKVDERLASHLDLFPTAMDMVHLKGLNHAVGSSLVREFNRDQLFFHNPFIFGYFGTRKKGSKLIYTKSTDSVENYNLEEDPAELKNLAPDFNPQLLEDVKAYLSTFKSLYNKKGFCPPKLTGRSSSIKGIEEALDYKGLLVEADLSKIMGLKDVDVNALCKKHPELIKLKLQDNTTITDAALNTPLENLSFLDLSHCLLFTDEGITQTLESYKHLSDFYLNGLTDITDKALLDIKSQCPHLHNVKFKECSIGDKGLLALAKLAPNLIKATFSLTQITEQGLIEFAKCANDLEELYLSDCEQISDEVVRAFTTYLPKLNYLLLTDCHQITDHSLESLMDSTVQNLFLKQAHSITDHGLKSLAKAPLRILTLQGCSGVSDKGVQYIMENTSCMKILTVDNALMISKYSTYDL
ncbi:MAG: hypothetical protein SP1CHLAM54_07680 [Chlamydiia bacterium]|nr:hypothetical protein [Chlamydiia bacterium]MCH9615674.1 hypothetical protein [Chlamydiia bacterium]MCH9628923.1 hypothetical protein [Chlamydiia bacterium]